MDPDATNGAAVDPTKERLSLFLARNPPASFERRDGRARIIRPWGDDTLELDLEAEAATAADTLNELLLPPPLTAVWHFDSHDLEVIAAPLPKDHEWRNRSFEFTFETRTYSCGFEDASERVVRLARMAEPVGPASQTLHRNMQFFSLLLHYEKDHPGHRPSFVPTSFWIRDVEWDEDKVLELARHLNFYMCYFDQESPRILIHEIASGEDRPDEAARFPFGTFPNSIAGQPLDPYLLSLWTSSVNSPDPFRRFLYSYQILEYCAFYFLQDHVSRKVRRVLASPDVSFRLDEAVAQLMDAVVDHRSNPDEQIRSVVKEFVDPVRVWTQIEPNIGFFSQELRFEGGFELAPIAREGWSAEDFAATWIPTFPDSIRKLRNALVHAREARSGAGIAPSRSNYAKIKPWLGPLSVTAMQTMLFREVAR